MYYLLHSKNKLKRTFLVSNILDLYLGRKIGRGLILNFVKPHAGRIMLAPYFAYWPFKSKVLGVKIELITYPWIKKELCIFSMQSLKCALKLNAAAPPSNVECNLVPMFSQWGSWLFQSWKNSVFNDHTCSQGYIYSVRWKGQISILPQ